MPPSSTTSGDVGASSSTPARAPAASAPIRLLLADDHIVLRAGTRRILEDEPDLRVVAEAGDGQEAITLAELTKPNVILLDIAMPGTDGIAASKELRRVAPAAKLLILTAHGRRAYVGAFQRLGAAGYLLKSTPPEELIAAIRRVHAGEYVYDISLLDRLIATVPAATDPTVRELEVMRALARGLTNREIGDALGLSEHTIEFHLRNVYAKLGAASRADALLNAQRNGWLDSPDPLC